jgi:hypothetical protein
VRALRTWLGGSVAGGRARCARLLWARASTGRAGELGLKVSDFERYRYTGINVEEAVQGPLRDCKAHYDQLGNDLGEKDRETLYWERCSHNGGSGCRQHPSS